MQVEGLLLVGETPDAFVAPALYADITSRRVFAFLIDWLILGVLGILLWLFAIPVILVTFGIALHGIVLLGGMMPAAYHTLTVGGPQSSTIGMRAMGIRLYVFNDNASNVAGSRPERGPTYAQALVMFILFHLSWIILTPLSLLFPLFNRHRRTLHDIGSGLIALRTVDE